MDCFEVSTSAWTVSSSMRTASHVVPCGGPVDPVVVKHWTDCL